MPAFDSVINHPKRCCICLHWFLYIQTSHYAFLVLSIEFAGCVHFFSSIDKTHPISVSRSQACEEKHYAWLAHYVGVRRQAHHYGQGDLTIPYCGTSNPLAPSKVSIMRAAEKSHIFPACDLLLLLPRAERSRAEQSTKLKVCSSLIICYPGLSF
jgi:hypothetical protein